jgi:hypothetical protein
MHNFYVKGIYRAMLLTDLKFFKSLRVLFSVLPQHVCCKKLRYFESTLLKRLKSVFLTSLSHIFLIVYTNTIQAQPFSHLQSKDIAYSSKDPLRSLETRLGQGKNQRIDPVKKQAYIAKIKQSDVYSALENVQRKKQQYRETLKQFAVHTKLSELPLLRIYHGNSGEPLLTAEEVQKKIKENAKNAPKLTLTRVSGNFTQPKAVQKKENSLQNEGLKIPVIPECTASKTVHVPTSIKYQSGKEVTLVDTVYMEAKALPKDPDVVFGVHTTVIPYNAEGKEGVSLMISGQGIECLPYRERRTTKGNYYYYGKDALKKFEDKNKKDKR